MAAHLSVKDLIEAKARTEAAVAEYEKHLHYAGPYLERRGISEEVAKRFRLGVCSGVIPEHAHMKNRLIIPYLTPTGPLAIKARCLKQHACKEEHCAKYLAQDDSVPLLYNTADLLGDADVLYVCEGELDAVVVSGMLHLACVAYPGTSAWRPYFNRAVGPDWAGIVVVADGDEPGRDAARSTAKHLRGRVLKLPDGEDTNSLMLKVGVDETRKLFVDFARAFLADGRHGA